MSELFGLTFGRAGGTVLSLLFAASLVLYCFLPFLALFAVVSLRGIRRELKRANDARDHIGATSGAGVLGL